MILTDPYQTSLGKLIDTDKVIKEIQRYLITTKNYNLNYEYMATSSSSDNVRLVFITGCDEDEKELPVWSYPLVFEDMKKTQTIAVDLRKFTKDLKNQPLTLESVMRDEGSSKFLINTALIMADFITENFGAYRPVYNNVTIAYGMLISYLVTSCVALNPIEHLDVELAATYFANLLLTPGTEYLDYRDAIIARMSNSKFSLPITKKSIAALLDKIEAVDDLTIAGLIRTIQYVLPEEKKGLITDNLLISLLGNMWYGNGVNDALVIGLEYMPLWIALCYTALGDKTYKRARLSTVLEKSNRHIGVKDFLKVMDLVMKEKIMDIR